ncbi:uncharacterized protein FIBRA_03490 [Fibroporia radiculosa]|uniref:Brl1/Brr6 domain-containing protein n=1 Tax=Fibroporia radiculosa TaxID=599839 RepID=J4G5N3_9APHY|nr:uncharacterized protein FIBRA_03490 [Fibroporia radiculosa]CCM01438.1 predicted protein [Fibroporia radiculosa]
MTTRYGTTRTVETPMDFEFTSRPSSFTKPVWAQDGDSPRKRPLADVNASSPTFPTFGAQKPSNVPFLFQEPPPHSSHPPAWAPPPRFAPEKTFPQPELRDIDMVESSPPRPGREIDGAEGRDEARSKEAERAEGEEKGERMLALGGMRRVFRSRQQKRTRSRLGRGRRRGDGIEHSDEESDSDSDGENEGERGLMPQTTSNHYTLNMAGPAPPPSDLPYVLLGYLQFFFNLSLVLVFLYVLVQFILTVQRDVEQKISEYSMEIVQEIAQCAMQYKANLCATNPIPAMAHQCSVWETCMNRDPSKVGRAKVGAELIAEVVNGFVEPISWKTLVFSLSSLAFATVFVNALLSLYRARINPAAHTSTMLPPQPVSAFPIAPPPYSHHYMHSPAVEWSGKPWPNAENEVNQTPSRRRKLDGGAVEKIR